MTFELTLTRGGEEIKITVDPLERVDDSLDGVKNYWDLEEDFELYDLERRELDRNINWAENDIEDGSMMMVREGSKDLPDEILSRRIHNEIDRLKDEGYLVDELDDEGFDLMLTIKAPGPVKVDHRVGLVFEHNLTISITEGYPSTSPLIEWKSDIYHPNISFSKDCGKVKTSYLEEWDFDHDLVSLTKHLEELLTKPERDKTIDTDRCKNAQEFYDEHGFPSL